MDDVEISMGIDFDFDVFPEEPTVESDNAYDFEYQKGGDYDHAESPLQGESSKSADDERLWWPLIPEEPVLDPVLLSGLDAIADQLQVTRLQDMDVLVGEQDISSGVELGGHPAIRTSGAARFLFYSRLSLAKQICINMVPTANFPCWFAKENEKSESIVESCLHLPSAFFEPQKMHG